MQSYDVWEQIPNNLAKSSSTCVDKQPFFGQIEEIGPKVVQTIFFFVKSWRLFRDLKHSTINFAADMFIVEFKIIRIMEFRLKTCILLKKEFVIETEHLKDAMDMVQKQLIEETDLNTLEKSYVGFDMTDPSIREYNGKMCKKQIEEYYKKCAIQP